MVWFSYKEIFSLLYYDILQDRIDAPTIGPFLRFGTRFDSDSL